MRAATFGKGARKRAPLMAEEGKAGRRKFLHSRGEKPGKNMKNGEILRNFEKIKRLPVDRKKVQDVKFFCFRRNF